MKLITAVFAFLLPVLSFSQKFDVHSVLITKANDSLHVLTAERQSSPSKSVRALDSSSGQYHTYLASELSGVIVGSDGYYISAIVNIDQTPYNEEVAVNENTFRFKTDTVFLKTEYRSNAVKLFSFKDPKRTHFFVQKNTDSIEELIYVKFLLKRSGTLYETEDKKFIARLSDLLDDCPEALRNIENIGYSVQAIQGVLDKYNRLCHKDSVSHYRSVYKDKFEIAVLVGGGFSKLVQRTSGTDDNTLTAGFSPIVGIRFNYILPILQHKLSIVGDLYYNSYHATSSAYSNFINDSFYTKNNTDLKNKYINLDVLARYYLLDDKSPFRAFFNIGYTAGAVISSNNTVVTNDVFNSSNTTQTNEAFPNTGYHKLEFGFEAGAGLTWNRIGIEYRYRKYSNILSYTNRSLSMASNNFLLSYRLTK